MEDEVLAKIQAKNPDRELAIALGPTGEIVLGTPTQAQYLQYRVLLRSESIMDNAKAADELLLMCAVEPTRDVMATQLKKKPGMATHPEILRAIGELCGTVSKK